MNVRRLDGRLLNFWVAKSAGLVLSTQASSEQGRHDPESGVWHPHSYNPASDWSHAGAIVAEEWFFIEDKLTEWFGPHWPHTPAIADQPLVWFMRAYVATHFGDEVEDVYGPPAAPHLRDPEPLAATPRIGSKLLGSSWLRQLSW